MTSAKSRSQLGRMSRNKGAKAERDLVAYLRTVGFGGAERAVRTGYRTTDRVSADPGDVTGLGPIIVSMKDCAVEELAKWLAELDAMQGREFDVRLLIHKRSGKADPARWWCWMRTRILLRLIDESYFAAGHYDAPVRMELGHVVPLLHEAGYGDPIEVAS